MASETIYSDAPNQDFDLSGGGPVQILSQALTDLVKARDQIVVELNCTILNNSGVTRTYTPTVTLGSFSMGAAEGATVAVSAVNRRALNFGAVLAVSANNLTYGMIAEISSAAIAPNTSGSLSTGLSNQLFNSTTNDETGAQTVTVSVASSVAAAVQTLTLHSWSIRHIPQKLA